MRAELSRVVVTGPADLVAGAQLAAEDLRKVGKIIGDLDFVTADVAELTVEAELAPVAEDA